jgi:hypothetical protein
MPIHTYTTIDDPLATNGTDAFGINDNGQIVGQYLTGKSTTALSIAVAPTRASTIPWPPPPGWVQAPLRGASTRRARSSGLTLTP